MIFDDASWQMLLLSVLFQDMPKAAALGIWCSGWAFWSVYQFSLLH